MPTSFPGAFDVPANPTLNTSMAGSGFEHDLQHTNINDMMKAVQVRIGLTNSPDTTSVTNQVNTAGTNITALQGSVSTLNSQLGITNANLTVLTNTVSGLTTSVNNLTATKLNLAGGSMTGQLTVQYRPPAVSAGSYTTAQLLLSNIGSADNPPQLGFQAAGLLGLSLYLNASGLNAITNLGGSSLIINTSGQLNPLSFSDGSVPSVKIVPGSIGTDRIATAAITNPLLAPGAVDASKIASGTRFIPAGLVFPYGGGASPAGFLPCDGNPYPTATYPDLFGALGYTYGGSGASFNVPDLRGRTVVGAGSGPGLTPRGLGGTVGEENHALSIAELAAHNHAQPDHYHTIPGGGNHNHGASLGDHRHAMPAGSFTHAHSDSGHSHTYVYSFGAGGGSASNALPVPYAAQSIATGVGYAALSTYNSPTVETYWTSQYGGIPGVTVNNSGNITPNTSWESQTMGAVGVISNTGSGTPHQNMPPSLFLSYVIKT